MSEPEQYPHLRPWQRELLADWGDLLTNTGGNDPADLLNDLQRPQPNNLMSTNIVRFTLAVAIEAQVSLLAELRQHELLKERG